MRSFRKFEVKKLILLSLLASCSHQKAISEKEIDIHCQDLNVLYQKINVIASNFVNSKTTRTAEGGYYKRKMAQNCKDGFCDIISDDAPPVLRYEPKHPDANKNGFVAYPNINLQIEEADKVFWSHVYETVVENSPLPNNFFFKDKRAKACFSKYPSLRYALDYSVYLGRDTNHQALTHP